MSATFQIAGYDKQTERLAIAYPVPEALSAMARGLARVGFDDDGEGAYRLEPTAAVTLGRHMDAELNPDKYDWFLEPRQND